MSEARDGLPERFEANRARLAAVAYRMLGSKSEAHDAVQEAWLRLQRSDAAAVENLGGWLTTVVARVCLDMLRSRKSRREEPLEAQPATALERPDGAPDPERELLLADSLGPALLVVLDSLEPGERLAFVLHDMFAVPFEDIAPIVGRTPAAARQLASRARRRVRGAQVPDADQESRRRVVEAFLAASRDGSFEALLALLHPDIVVRADAATVAMGGQAEVRGAEAVARTFLGRARAVLPMLVDGAVQGVWLQAGQARIVLEFTIVAGRVAALELQADPERLSALELRPLEG